MIDERNITEILCEEENLRKFRHENIIDFYGSCPRRKDPDGPLQILMIMELCDSTLRFRIIGKEAVNPGKLAEQDGKTKSEINAQSSAGCLYMAKGYTYTRCGTHPRVH